MTSSEILMAVFTAVIATTGVIGALIFNNQLSVMQGQLDEMKSTGKQTEALIKSSSISAEASQTQAKAAAESNVAAVKALQQSQRPWVIVESIEFARPITYTDDKYEMLLNLNLKNTGNSVATDVFTVLRLEENKTATLEPNWNKTDDDLRQKKETIIKPSKWPLGIVLAPSQAVPQPFGFGGPTPIDGSPSAERIKAGAFYFLGLLEYKDQFGITHTTRFAFNLDPWGSNTLVVSGGMQEAN
jgi:hypothetical protein